MCRNKEHTKTDVTQLQGCFHSFPTLHHALVEGTWKTEVAPKKPTKQEDQLSAGSIALLIYCRRSSSMMRTCGWWRGLTWLKMSTASTLHPARKHSRKKGKWNRQTMEDAECLMQNSEMLLRGGQNKMHCTINILHRGMVLVKSTKFAEKRKHKVTKGHTGYVRQS